MKTSFLDFEHAIAELEGKIEVLRAEKSESSVDVSVEIALLESKCQTLTQEIYADLTPWQTAQVARHPQRPAPVHRPHRHDQPARRKRVVWHRAGLRAGL